MRYPLIEHERYNDTFLMHTLADSITERNRAVWTFSPLSYLGYYPASYPSGTPFVLAVISMLCGIGMNVSVLSVDMYVALLFPLAVFLLSKHFVKRVEYALLAAYLASMAPRLIDSSYWNGSSRTLFVTLATLMIGAAFRAALTKNHLLYVPVTASIIGCFSLHHMAVLFLVIGIAYIFAVLLANVLRKLLYQKRETLRLLPSIVVVVLFLVVLISSVFFLDYFVTDLRNSYKETSVFKSKSLFLSIAVNITISYTNQVGFVLPIAFLGIPTILRRSRVATETLFPIALLIVLVPLAANSLYIAILVTPFVALIGTTWVSMPRKEPIKRLVTVLLVILITSSVFLPVWSVTRWNSVEHLSGDIVEADNQVFNDGAWLRVNSDEAYAIGNVDILSQRLSAISKTPFLRSGIEATLTGDITADNLRNNITWTEEEFPRNLYLWFDSSAGPEATLYVIAFMLHGTSYVSGVRDMMPSGEQYFEIHQKMLVVIDNRWPTNYVWGWGIYPAKLPTELSEASWSSEKGETSQPLSSQLLYRSERVSVFSLEVPR